MDDTGLTILTSELAADVEVAREAAERATQRLRESSSGHLEAAAYEPTRLYNILERMFERICTAFENHFEKRGDYHERLLQRLALALPGIRPAFIPATHLPALRELKGFRYVVRHAYDLTLRPDRLTELAAMAEQVTAQLPAWCAGFTRQVRQEQGWTPS